MKNLEEMRQGKTSKKLHHIIATHESVKPLGIFYWLNCLTVNSANFLSTAKENKSYSNDFPFGQNVSVKMRVKVKIYRDQNNYMLQENWNKWYRVPGPS